MSHRGLHSDPLRRSTPPARPVASVVATLRPARSTVTMVAVASVAPNPTNPPGRSEANLDELISSIRQVGVLQAVTVVPAAQYLAVHPEQVEQIGDADFVTLGGHRRRAAAVLAGIHEMPAVIRTDLGPRLDEVAAHENLHRRAFNPIEEALTFRLNLEVQGLSQRQLATALCLSQAHISKRLALLRLPAAVQDAIAANELSVADGLRLAREDHPGVLERVAEGLTERQVSMEERIAAAAVEVARDRDRERAAAVAAAQGLALVTDPAGAFGTSWQRHRLHDAEQIDRARERGDLAVGIPDGKEPVPYYRLSAPRDLDGPSTPTPTRGEARERSAAARARTAHLITLAPSKPSSAQWSRLLAEVTIGGWTVASPTGTALVRRLARQAGVGPVAPTMVSTGSTTPRGEPRSWARRPGRGGTWPGCTRWWPARNTPPHPAASGARPSGCIWRRCTNSGMCRPAGRPSSWVPSSPPPRRRGPSPARERGCGRDPALEDRWW